MKVHAFVPLLILPFVLASPSRAQSPEANAGSAPERVGTTAAHLGVGIIRNIEVDRRIVTIEHRAIPSLGMPAMTMPFRLAESISAGSLSTGQLVAFFLSSASDGVVITSMQAIAGSPQASPGQALNDQMPGIHGDGKSPMPGMHGMDMMDKCRHMMSNK